MTEDQIQAAVEGHRARNSALRQVLVEEAISLTEDRPIEVHFWASDQTDAALLARELYRRGYLVTVLARVSSEQKDERWNVEAGAKMSPDMPLGDGFTESLIRLAAAYDCAYDGWGTAV